MFILQFLKEQNYLESFQCVQKETALRYGDFELDGNMSLETLFRDHEDYFEFKYGKAPVYFRLNGEQRKEPRVRTLPSITEKDLQGEKAAKENALEVTGVREQVPKEIYLKERVISIPSHLNKTEGYELAR